MVKSNNIFKILLVILGLFLTLGLFACDDQDKKAAGLVDEAILAIAETVSLDDEEDIIAARAAFDALTETQKALVTKITLLEDKETAIINLKNIAAAVAVDNLINAIPATVVLSHKTQIEGARAAYNALTPTQKTLVTKLTVLETKESALSALQNDANKAKTVEDKITALPATITLNNENAILAARGSYDVLTESQKALVPNLAILEAAEAKIANLKLILSVEDLIDALPETISLADEADVIAAREAFDELSTENQNEVSNITILEAAEAKINQLKAEKADLDAANAFDALVSSLPQTVAISDKDAVIAARTAYEALTETQKALVTKLYSLQTKETRIANLEAAKIVIDKINEISDPVTLADETVISEARTLYNALNNDQKAYVTNYEDLQDAEYDLDIVKNPDLAYLLPVINQVPTHIIDDFLLPTTGGVVWSFKNPSDNVYFDIETGELLKTTYGVALVTLIATYNTTSREVTINFGLLQEGQKAIFYTGDVKPSGGTTADGFGTYETQLLKAGFGGYMITVGNKVYFISKDAFIPISGTTANERISRETLRPLGLSAQTAVNNIGLKNGTPIGYSGAGALYYNSGSVPVTFDASDTYGRLNVPTLGFGKIVFKPNQDGSYTVQKYLADHSIAGSGDTLGSTNVLITTLNPGEYLWTPHSWEVDYSSIGYGTGLNQLHNGVLAENTKILVKPYKIIDPDMEAVLAAIEEAPTEIYFNTLLPTTQDVIWTYKNGQDNSFYDIETGEIMKLSFQKQELIFVVSKGNYSKEVKITIGVLGGDQTGLYYLNNQDSIFALDFGWNGYTLTLEDGKTMFLGESALIELRAMETGEEKLPLSVLQPYSDTPSASANLGIISKNKAQNPGYGALYHNPNDAAVIFNSKDIYGVQANATEHAQNGMVIINKDGVVIQNLDKDSLASTEGINITLQPGDYLWCPHVYDKNINGEPFTSLTDNVNFQVDKIVKINKYQSVYVISNIEKLIDSIPNEPTFADETDIIAIRDEYNSLTAIQKSYVSNITKLEAAETYIANLKIVNPLIDQINALSTDISLDDEEDVIDARAAYEILNTAQKALVSNYNILTAAETKIVDLKAAKPVVDFIATLSDPITIDDKNDVEFARILYDGLTETQKSYVTNSDILTAAETVIDTFDINNVIALIDLLPDTVAFSDLSDILEARAAYDALKDSLKNSITNIEKLETCESNFEYKTVTEVLTLCDTTPGEVVLFEGIVIGITIDNYFFVADSTGSIYIRRAATNLAIGDKVIIEGTTFVFKNDIQYTRQINQSGTYNILKVGTDFVNPLSAVSASYTDLAKIALGSNLSDDDLAAIKAHSLYGKYVSVTGYVITQGTFNNVYLAESLDSEAAKILVYYQSAYYDELKTLIGKQITISGPIYNYTVADGWAITYVGEIDVALTDEEKEDLALEEIHRVITEGKDVISDLAFFTKAPNYPYTLAGVTFTFSSSNTALISNTGIYNAPDEDTVVTITVDVNFISVHQKTYTYSVTASAPMMDIFISEYGEGSSNNKWLEIYNPNSKSIDLSSYTLKVFANGASTTSSALTLSGTLDANSTYVICNTSSNATIKALANLQSNTVTNFNGDDAVVLYKGNVIIDIIGEIGVQLKWPVGSGTTENQTIVRKASISSGNPIWDKTEWDAYANDTFTYIGAHTYTPAE